MSTVPGWLTPSRGAALAALVAGLAYLNAPANGFAYDDVPVIVNDSALAQSGSLPERLTRPYWPEDARAELGLWRPLTTAAFWVQSRFGGPDPTLFHATNVVLHGLVAGLVVFLGAEFVGLLAATLAGLLFAVHPVHVEAVANAVGLSELLSAALYLGACLLFLRWTRPGRHEEVVPLGGRRTSVLCLLYFAAFLAKESAATLPAALFVLELVRRPVSVRDREGVGRQDAGSLGHAGPWLRSRAGLLAGMASVAGAVLLLRWSVLGSVADPDPPLGAHLLEEIPRVWTLGVIWLHYLRLMVLPLDLSADYGPDVIPILTVWTPAAIAGVTLVLALLALSLVGWRRANRRPRYGRVPALRLPALVAVWFVVTISPVANVLFLSGVLLAERTLYLPSVCVALAGGWLLARFLRWRAAVGWGVVVAVLMLMAARTWTRTPTWESTERVFVTMIEERPESGRAQWTLGDMLLQSGRTSEAKAAYRRAAGRLDSSYRLLMEVGWDAVRRDEVGLGVFLFRRAWRDAPGRASAPRRLAVTLSRAGRHGEAVEAARATVELAPSDVATWHVLAGSLTALGSWDEAIEARERVIALGEGGRWQQWLSLARLRLTAGDEEGAREALDAALERTSEEAEREAVRVGFTPFAPPSDGL